MTLVLPGRFRDKLLADGSSGRLLGIVSTALVDYTDWLTHSRTGMPFFPDYTNHSIGHLQEVVKLADFLVADGSNGTPDAWAVLTPIDVAALVLAALTHDAGMYLDELAFLALIRDPAILVPECDTKPWGMLWEEFFGRARRWDERARTRVFGSVAATSREVRRPPDEVHLWDEIDRRLAGEFVREHHARLAHEIALAGWPRPDQADRSPPLCVAIDAPDVADLAGLVARSHGIPMRDALSHFEARMVNPVEWRGAHPAYLAAVLRIADFLNLHAQRAPTALTAIRKLTSPVSKMEWAAHAAIRDIRIDAERDPASVAVDVDPHAVPDMATLNRLGRWVSGLQHELDLSWAVIGELYGRHQRLCPLWLRVRRVESNLSSSAFAKQLSFIPIDARMSADPDLALLLVHPLYGEQTDIGVREMVQNSVDAVRERRYLVAHRIVRDLTDISEVIDPRAPDADVVVSFATRTASTPTEADGGPPQSWMEWLEVADRGVGMTAEVARDFFFDRRRHISQIG